MRAIRFIVAGMIVVGVCATRAKARVEFDLSIGYSHLELDGSERFERRDGVRIEPRVSFDGIIGPEQLRLGFGLGISGYSHELEDDVIITIDEGDEIHIFEADQWESVGLLAPEFQISWRQTFGGDERWFVEPGVAAGAVFANYAIYDDWGYYYDDDYESEWDMTFGVRPFVRVGWRGDRWVFGGEASYLVAGDVELIDQVQGDVSELYIGGFFGYRF